jgi:DNA-nicking Smr family endonuclease
VRLTHAEIVDLTSSTMPQLDLHGEFAREAAIAVYGYVTRMASSGESCCRIVHGKGTGVLQQVVTRELDELLEQGVIEASFQSQKYPGAAVVVVFPPSR